MNRWVEERVEAIRLALGIREFPGEEDLYRLVEWLGPCVMVRRGPVPLGMCVHRPDRRAVITLPRDVTGQELDHILAEELGHYLLTCGMAALLRQISPDDHRAHRLARRWEWRDEALAREFVQAWYLPSCLVQQIREDDELAARSRCSFRVVRQRRESLGGEVVELQAPPRWSALREYRLVRQEPGVGQVLYDVRRQHGAPAFLFAVTRAEEEGVAGQLMADLLALTATEFELKYGEHRCPEGPPSGSRRAGWRTWVQALSVKR